MELEETALRTLENNTVNFGGHMVVVPHISYYPWPYCWDTALHTVALAYYDNVRASENIEALLSVQKPDGMIPNAPTPKDEQDMRSQPPLIIHAVRRYAEITGDLVRVRRWFNALIRYYGWWREKAVHPISPHGLSSPCTKVRINTDLTAYYATCSTGMDNHPVYDFTEGELAGFEKTYYIPVEDLLINSLLTESADSLAFLADILGMEEVGRRFREDYIRLIKTINEVMWSGGNGLYYPCVFNGKHI